MNVEENHSNNKNEKTIKNLFMENLSNIIITPRDNNMEIFEEDSAKICKLAFGSSNKTNNSEINECESDNLTCIEYIQSSEKYDKIIKTLEDEIFSKTATISLLKNELTISKDKYN